MKAEYMWCVKMPGIGLLHKTMGTREQEAIEAFSKFDGRLSWLDAMKAGYKIVKVVVVELT
jgi:hypothetical protein